MKDTCDHAGIWKPETKFFEFIAGCPVELEVALEHFNAQKERVTVLKNGRWFLTDFIGFQYGGKLNVNNHLHKSVLGLLAVNGVKLTSKSGELDPKLTSRSGDVGGNGTPKDKDKDKDKDMGVLMNDTSELLGFFQAGLNWRHAEKARMNYGAAGKLFKSLLKDYPKDEIKKRIEFWLQSTDPFVVKRGWRVEDFGTNFNNLKTGPMVPKGGTDAKDQRRKPLGQHTAPAAKYAGI